jgi:hypothetical protein
VGECSGAKTPVKTTHFYVISYYKYRNVHYEVVVSIVRPWFCALITLEPDTLLNCSIMSVSKTFPPLTMNSNLPIAVEIDESPDRIRADLLDRLYWNVSSLQSDIAVREGDTLVPFENHAICS